MRVLITGASRGLGLEFSRRCLERGDRVFAAARRPDMSDGLQGLQKVFPDRLVAVPLDVSDQVSLDRCFFRVREQTQALDLLINNAGIGHTSWDAGDRRAHTKLGRLDPDRILQVFRVNAVGPLMVTQRFVELLKLGSIPRVIHITSALGSLSGWSSGGSYSYDASKAALNMLNHHLARDLLPWGIVSVVVHPGWVRTDMGGPNAPLSPEESVRGVLRLADRLTERDAGRFFQWNGAEHPW